MRCARAIVGVVAGCSALAACTLLVDTGDLARGGGDAAGSALFFTGTGPATVGGFDLFVAARVSGDFADRAALPSLETTSDESDPSAGAQNLYFTSDRQGNWDLYVAPRIGAIDVGHPAL